jgi:4-oxalomesaconate tautomerase
MQTKIPCVLMRGGTSKGPFFKASDLPDDDKLREQVLLAALGSPDERQIDGVGGADPLTSKVAVVKRSTRPGVDLDYLFIQVMVEKPVATTKQNCGNMLAGVGQFAIEQGLIEARGDETTLTVYMENTDSLCDLTFPTPGGVVTYDGNARIDGVPGTSASVMTNFRGTEGSTCGALLPTGNLVDVVNGIEVTLIDNGMPCVILEAKAVGRTGYESRDEMNADTELKKVIEDLRLAVGPMMNLGDVKDLSVPKMTPHRASRKSRTVSASCSPSNIRPARCRSKWNSKDRRVLRSSSARRCCARRAACSKATSSCRHPFGMAARHSKRQRNNHARRKYPDDPRSEPEHDQAEAEVACRRVRRALPCIRAWQCVSVSSEAQLYPAGCAKGKAEGAARSAGARTRRDRAGDLPR